MRMRGIMPALCHLIDDANWPPIQFPSASLPCSLFASSSEMACRHSIIASCRLVCCCVSVDLKLCPRSRGNIARLWLAVRMRTSERQLVRTARLDDSLCCPSSPHSTVSTFTTQHRPRVTLARRT